MREALPRAHARHYDLPRGARAGVARIRFRNSRERVLTRAVSRFHHQRPGRGRPGYKDRGATKLVVRYALQGLWVGAVSEVVADSPVSEA